MSKETNRTMSGPGDATPLRSPSTPVRLVLGALVLGALSSGSACTRFGAVYPARPAEGPGVPVADPSPSRVTTHVTLTGTLLRDALDGAVPTDDEGTFEALHAPRKYRWHRKPFELAFSQGRIEVDTDVLATVELPLTKVELPMRVHVIAEPIVSSEYRVKLQGVDVQVTSTDRRLRVADSVLGVLDTVGGVIKQKVKDFSYDLRTTLDEAYGRLSKPIEFPLAEARGCARLRVLGIEAGPTILADGLEKDLAMIVAPQVTLPCTEDGPIAPLPPLANVATIVPGPFTVTVPIAARYDELAKAMQLTFTDGRFHFSKEYPELYLETPELYASQGDLVLRLHLHGPVHKLGIDTDLDGDLYLTGHPTVVDNEVRLPDLEPTIETRNFLLKLKAMTDGDTIRDQARAALRLDVAERVRGVREHLSKTISFDQGLGCFRGDVDKVEITGVHAHANYLRVVVAVTARTTLRAPCASN
ncbi:MAG: DUF4403 family protein [Polyangiaceae bacterium]